MLAPTDEAGTLPGNLQKRLEFAFERGAGHGLLELGIREVGTILPAEFAYWRDFAGRYVTMLCTTVQPVGATSPVVVSAVETLPSETLVELASSAPPMPGGEYLNSDVLAALWNRIHTACRNELADGKQTLQEFLIKTSGYESDCLGHASARIDHLGLHLMQSMTNMQSLIDGGQYGKYNNPGHR